jgi:hypothetical protein
MKLRTKLSPIFPLNKCKTHTYETREKSKKAVTRLLKFVFFSSKKGISRLGYFLLAAIQMVLYQNSNLVKTNMPKTHYYKPNDIRLTIRSQL